MARMIPEVIDPESSPPGEVEIFQLLRDQAPNDWTVLHSLDLADHVVQVSGEVDFVILIPGLAVICLEVKSHQRVICDQAGLWRLGKDDPTTRGPFRQASEGMHSVRRRATAKTSTTGVPFVSAVAFPRCRFEVDGSEWDDWQVFDESALSLHGITACLSRVGTRFRTKLAETKTAVWFNPSSTEPTDDQCASIVRALRPSFEQHRSPKARQRAVDAEIRKYTDEQFEALENISDNDRVIFTGAAGTGKTFLAVEAARQASVQNETVLLCCYNRLLGQWLERDTAPLAPNVRTTTLHKLMLSLANTSVPDSAPAEFWTHTLPELALDQLLNADRPPQFDRLIIDEAQDVCTEAYLDVLDLLVSDGFQSGKWLAFGDFEHQALYTDNDSVQRLRSRSEQSSSFALGINCRNRPAVGTFGGHASGKNPYRKFRRPEDGVLVDLTSYSSSDEQRTLLLDAIERLKSAGHQAGEITVLSSKTQSVAAQLHETSPNVLTAATSARSHKVGFSTIHAFKGLEAPAVIVTDVDDLQSTQNRQLLYVAATRATDRLVVLYRADARQDLTNLMIGSA